MGDSNAKKYVYDQSTSWEEFEASREKNEVPVDYGLSTKNMDRMKKMIIDEQRRLNELKMKYNVGGGECKWSQ